MAQSTFHPTIAAAQLEIKQGSAHSPRRDHLNVRTCGYDKAALPASTFSTTYSVPAYQIHSIRGFKSVNSGQLEDF